MSASEVRPRAGVLVCEVFRTFSVGQVLSEGLTYILLFTPCDNPLRQVPLVLLMDEKMRVRGPRRETARKWQS